MSAISRRGGTKNIRVNERTSDPGGASGEVQVYSKDVGGTTQLFAQSGDSSVTQLTPLQQLASTAPGAARGDYIRVELSTNQVDPAVTDFIEFATSNESRGDLTLINGGTGTAQVDGLKAGRTYLCVWTVGVISKGGSNANGSIGCRIRDVANAALLGTTNTETFSIGDRQNTISQGSHPTQSYVFTPDIDTSIAVEVSVTNGSIDASAQGTFLEIIEIGTVQANVIGGWELLDRIEVTSPTQTITFSATGDGENQYPLDGDVDEFYILKFRHVKGAPGVIEVRPNNVTTNLTREILTVDAGTPSGSTGAAWTFSGSGSSLDRHAGILEIDARTGMPRTFISRVTDVDVGSNNSRYTTSAGAWDETSTNITSLVITSATANIIDTGSVFELYRVTSKNTRADSASTYERTVTTAVAEGSATTEQTTGPVLFGGSIVGLNAQIEEAVASGTVTVNAKINSTTEASVVLDATNTTVSRNVYSPDAIPFVAGDEITIEVVASSYDNAANVTSALTANLMLVSSGLVLPGDQTTRSELWAAPDRPGSEDDEFTSDTSSLYTIDNAISGNAIDPYALNTGSGANVSWGTRRNSWLQVQPDESVNNFFLRKTWEGGTVPTNAYLIVRAANNWVDGVNTTGTLQTAIQIGLQEAGVPLAGHYAATSHHTNISGNVYVPNGFKLDSGGSAAFPGTQQFQPDDHYPVSEVGIQKIGNVIHYWAMTDRGGSIHLGSFTYSGNALTQWFLRIYSDGNPGGLGTPVLSVDYVRGGEGIVLPR